MKEKGWLCDDAVSPVTYSFMNESKTTTLQLVEGQLNETSIN